MRHASPARKRLARILAAIGGTFGRLALRVRGMQAIAGAEEDPPPTDKTFTKAEVEQMIVDRLTRDRKDRLSDDEIATLKARAQKADDLEAANLTESERLKAEALKATEDKVAAEQRATDAETRANQTLMKAQIISAAAKAGAVDSDAVYALLQADKFAVTKDGQKLEVTVGDDGQVTGHEEAVTAFLEAKTYLVGSTPTPGPGGGGPRPGPTSSGLTQEQREAAKSFGMTEEDYAKYADSPTSLETAPAAK